MTADPRRVTLNKSQRDTSAGRELIRLLVELSEDGQVTRDEMERLRAWLEVDRGIDLPACAFLYEIVDTISADGDITEDELDRLALGIERVLPNDVRISARDKRRELREARKRERMAKRTVEREQARARARAARERARPLHRGDYLIAGACRSAERREACETLSVGDAVVLEREPDNRHDPNAILILSESGDELGYVPREYTSQMASLLDAGAEYEATVKKIWERNDGYIVPIIVSVLRNEGATDELDNRSQQPKRVRSAAPAPAVESVTSGVPTAANTATATNPPTTKSGCLSAFLMLALLMMVGLMVVSYLLDAINS